MARGGRREGAGGKKGELKITQQMRFDILASLRSHGFDPLERVLWTYDQAKMLYERALETNQHWLINSRLQMMQHTSLELMKYVYPQRKAIELTGAGGEDLFQSFAEAVKQIHKEATQATNATYEVLPADKVEE